MVGLGTGTRLGADWERSNENARTGRYDDEESGRLQLACRVAGSPAQTVCERELVSTHHSCMNHG